MRWTRSETLGLGSPRCMLCHGMGLRASQEPCNCVFRAVFRLCFAQFRLSSNKAVSLAGAVLEYNPRTCKRVTYAMRNEEYAADFCLVSARALTPEQHRLFRLHFLQGFDWKVCCARLALGRGFFFHSLYRIQERLGRVFRELQPYGLFPIDEYFGGTVG
jgi:hypothetical protein